MRISHKYAYFYLIDLYEKKIIDRQPKIGPSAVSTPFGHKQLTVFREIISESESLTGYVIICCFWNVSSIVMNLNNVLKCCHNCLQKSDKETTLGKKIKSNKLMF